MHTHELCFIKKEPMNQVITRKWCFEKQLKMKLKSFLVIGCLLNFYGNIAAQTFNIGHTSKVFYDTTRNRNIETEIYYPAVDPG